MDYELLDDILRDKGMSRRKLAQLAGISENTLSAAFRRRSKNFPIENVQKIASVLNIEWWKLMGWTEYGHMVYGLPVNSPEEIEKISYRIWGKPAQIVHYKDGIQIDDNTHMQLIKEEMEKLNDNGQQEAVRQVSLLTKIPEYQRKPEEHNT